MRVRASDAERDAAVASLREHLVDGRLDLAEFVTRMEQAQAAVYVDELPPLFGDLPSRVPQPVGPAPMRRRRPVPPWPVAPLVPLVLVVVLMVGVGHVFPIWLPLLVVWFAASRHRWAARTPAAHWHSSPTRR